MLPQICFPRVAPDVTLWSTACICCHIVPLIQSILEVLPLMPQMTKIDISPPCAPFEMTMAPDSLFVDFSEIFRSFYFFRLAPFPRSPPGVPFGCLEDPLEDLSRSSSPGCLRARRTPLPAFVTFRKRYHHWMVITYASP